MSKEAPGHTDLMVCPETIDEWLEENPPQEGRAIYAALAESRIIIEWLLEGRELDEMDRARVVGWSQLCQKADEALEAISMENRDSGVREIWCGFCGQSNSAPCMTDAAAFRCRRNPRNSSAVISHVLQPDGDGR